MKITKKLMDFLFGKDPDIFDEKGNVLHRLPKKKWDAWNNKFKTDQNYNWRNHTGTRAGAKPQNPKQQDQ
jgi:hypothetical protein